MLSSVPLWKYRYTKTSSSKHEFLLLFPHLTPDYVAEAHFCLSRRTGVPLWEELFYKKRRLMEVFGVHGDIIALQNIGVDQGREGLWRISLREGEPIIPSYPDTFWGRRKQRNAQKNWWYMGDGYGLRGPINADGTVPTSSGLLDLKSLTLVHEEPFEFALPEFTPLQELLNTHRLALPPLGILRHRFANEPEEEIYGPNFHLDDSTVKQSFWLESEAGERLWEFDLAKETITQPPHRVALHSRAPYLLILLFWPTDRWKTPDLYSPGSYQIWVLDLRTGKIIQTLNPTEEAFGGEITLERLEKVLRVDFSQSFEHEVNHGNVDEGFRRFGQQVIIFG